MYRYRKYAAAIVVAALCAQAQQPARQVSPVHLRDKEIGWKLAPADQAYSSIDGKHLMQYVEDLTAFARTYRDDGHPQFWGRIIGTQADHDTSAWLQAKFKAFGLSDVHEQTENLVDQWMPQSWSVQASGSDGQTANLETAQPAYQTAATPA